MRHGSLSKFGGAENELAGACDHDVSSCYSDAAICVVPLLDAGFGADNRHRKVGAGSRAQRWRVRV